MPVSIEKVDFDWINRLALENVYLEDQQGNVLFEANYVSAGFDLWPFLQGKFVFTTVRLFGFSLNLQKEQAEDPLNLQFVIDAFARKDTVDTETLIDLRINSVLLRRGKVSYHVKSLRETPGKFNPKHIEIDNVSASIALKTFNNDSINAHIKRLGFDEVSGFSLDKLTMNIVGNRDSANIDHFEVRLPRSKISIDRANINLEKVEGLTTLLNDAPMELAIAPSEIHLQELAPFVPAFRNFVETVQLSAEASGTINNIAMKDLSLTQGENMQFSGMMELRGITNPGETYVFGRVNRMFITPVGLHNLLNNLSEQSVKMPQSVAALGSIDFTGEVSGFFDNLVAFGRFSSDIGTIQTDMIFGRNKEEGVGAHFSGHLSTSVLDISQLLKENDLLGNIMFDLSIDASAPVGGSLSGSVRGDIKEFDFKGYKYDNILLAGNFKKNGFDGIVQIDDPNGAFRAEGMFEHQGQNSIFNFTATLDNLRPDQLLLTDKYEEPVVSFRMDADFTGDNIDNLEGEIHIDSLQIKTASGDFFLRTMEIAASGHSDDRRLTIDSDILNGEVIGAYSFYTIVPSLLNTMEVYLPALVHSTKTQSVVMENNFSILLTIENTETLSNVLKLPVTILNQSRISGHYNNRYDRFRLEAWLPKFKIGRSDFESGYLALQNPLDKVDVQLRATNFNKKGLRNYLNLTVDAKENLVNTLINWSTNKEQLFKADLSASVYFEEEQDERAKPILRTEVSIDKSPVFINDSLWHVEPSAITIMDGRIDIDNFRINHAHQHIHLNGLVSENPMDALHLKLNEIELSYIFDILNIPVLQFAGEATGTFNINDLYGSRILNTDLEVQNFSFNQTHLGRLNLFSEWDDEQKGILMLGTIYKNDTTYTDVNGYIFPVKPNEGLSLHFDANDIDIAFLQPFLKDVAQNLKGSGFGHVHLYGPFKELNVVGDAYVKDAGMGIEFLNTYYTFSDSVLMDPGSIRLNNVHVYDKLKNYAQANVTFNHKHFKDYDFNAQIQANNVLVYDQTERNNPLMYGTAFGTGSATISGNENVIDFDINLRSEPNTELSLNFMNNSASDEYSFITFIDRDAIAKADSTASDSLNIIRPDVDEGAEIRMNLLVDVTPEATIELIMDQSAGDHIKGNSSGSLQIQYGNRSDLRMYGGIDIIEGTYNFSLQQLIHRDFKIREGSTISFQGDPYNANMSVNAIYSLTANLNDLDEGLSRESSRSNVPVNCVLFIDGVMWNPSISFDVELPGSNEELERQVRSFIDQDMTRQAVYLLVLSKFYTPDYTSNLNRSNELNAVASSAISSQLSSILNSITDKVQIGTNIRAARDGFTEETEVEMLLSSQLLDNRLIFNGNFGYRNSNLQQRNIFVGEFDLEYKLTPSGEIRLKAYNHANDMYQYLKQSLTTQGVGIMYKKDFTHFSEIFRRRKKEPVFRENEEIPAE